MSPGMITCPVRFGNLLVSDLTGEDEWSSCFELLLSCAMAPRGPVTLEVLFDFLIRASSQIFFSLSLGYGSQLALSSYNKFENNTQAGSIS